MEKLDSHKKKAEERVSRFASRIQKDRQNKSALVSFSSSSSSMSSSSSDSTTTATAAVSNTVAIVDDKEARRQARLQKRQERLAKLVCRARSCFLSEWFPRLTALALTV